MTYFNRQATNKVFPDQVASGPPTGLWENVKSGFKSMEATELLVSENRMINEAVSERRQRIEEITGKSYEEAIKPFTPDANSELGMALGEMDEAPVFGSRTESLAEAEAIERLRDSLPEDKRGRVLSNDQLQLRAKEIALDKVAQNEDIFARSGGAGGVVGQFLGGAGAQFTDPLVLATLPLGPASGARLGVAVAINGALAAGVTAAQQPKVQKWREELGLPFGVGIAAENVLLAGAAGAGITLGVGGVIKGLRRLSLRRQLEAFDDLVENPTAEQLAARNQLEAEARFSEDNPFTPENATIKAQAAAEAEHASRAAQVARAMDNDQPLPRFEEDGAPEPVIDRTGDIAPDHLSSEAVSEADALYNGIRQQVDEIGDFEVMLERTDGEPVPVSARQIIADLDRESAFLEEIRACR